MNRFKLLLVEDNEADVVLIRESLRIITGDPEIICVNDGEMAIRYLSGDNQKEPEARPNIILLDINLPRKSGHEVLQFIRNNSELKHMPVIMLSTSGTNKDILDSYCNGANSYIIKPMDLNEFIESMKQFSRYWLNTVQLPDC